MSIKAVISAGSAPCLLAARARRSRVKDGLERPDRFESAPLQFDCGSGELLLG